MADYIARTESANIGILETKLMKEYFHRLFFTQFMGKVKYSKKLGEPVIPNSPIVINRQPATQGMDHILSPMMKNPTQPEFYGDAQIEGNLERQSLYYMRTYIQQRRTGIELPPGNEGQRVSMFKLVAKGRTQVEEKLPRHTEIHITRTFYQGYSDNITASKSDNGLGKTALQHPNIYGAGVGEVEWNAASATHLANLHAVAQAVKAGSDANKLTARTLRRFWNYCDSKLIPVMNFGGFEGRPLLVSNDQMAQLWEDPEFYAANKDAGVRGSKNNLFTGIEGTYGGWVIFKRLFSVMGLSTTSSTATWGATNPLEGLDEYTTKGAITFGPGAMSYAWAKGPWYTARDYDHGNRQEVAGAMRDGFRRADLSDDPDTPTAVLNQSSAILLTESPPLEA